MAEALLCFPLLQILPLSHTLDSIGIVHRERTSDKNELNNNKKEPQNQQKN